MEQEIPAVEPFEPVNPTVESEVPDFQITACERLLATGDIDAAKHQMSALEDFVPATEQEWSRVHRLCMTLKDRTRAQVFTERFLENCDNNAQAHLASARNFMSVFGDRPRVRKALKAALENAGTDANFWRQVAEIQSAIENHEGLLEAAGKSLALDPADIELREKLIYSLGVLRRSKAVRTECKTLADLLYKTGVKDPLCWARLARIAVEAGGEKVAKIYINKAVELLLTTNYEADFELVRALLRTRQPKRAMHHVQSLLASDPQNLWLLRKVLTTAVAVRSHDVALLVIAQIRTIPYLDPEFLLQLDELEKATSRKRGGLLSRLFR